MKATAHATIRNMSPQLLVRNLDKSISFYTDKLGFELEFRYEDFYAGAVKDGFTVHLKTGQPSVVERESKRENNDLDIVFSVGDVDGLFKEYSENNVEIVLPLCDQPYGREFYIADPDGYIFAFLKN